MNNYFITGTSSGIGQAIVKVLLQHQDNKILGFSRTNKLFHPQFEHEAIDLSQTKDLDKISFPNLKKPKIIVLINNAGMLGKIKHIGQQKNQNIIDAMQVNFTSAAVLINQFIKKYQDVDCEKIIINISSGAATTAYDGWGNYCSAKAALNIFTEVIAKEQKTKQFPIKAFAIAPGVVDTIMQDTIRNTEVENFSNKGKFVDLKNNNQLYKAHDVAEKLVVMIQNTDMIDGIISRIRL